MQQTISFSGRYSFFLLALILVTAESILILQGTWNGDFWEHAAVVHELSRNPFHPSNPVINADIPHAYFSPYSLLTGLFSRVTGLDPVQTLTFFAFFNLVLFLFCYHKFCKAFFKTDTNLVAALGLIFILLFWGKDPISWSGFYHIFVFDHVLPYPSAFSMSLSLGVLAMLAKHQTGKFKLIFLPVYIFTVAVIFVSHPNTGMLLCCAVPACIWSLTGSTRLTLIRSSLILLPAFLLAICWPYYDLIFLLTYTNDSYFHLRSKHLYFALIQKNWPVVFVLPGIIWLKNDKAFRFLIMTMILAGLLYGIAYMQGKYGAGRLIAGIMFFGQVAIAYTLVCVYRIRPRYGTLYRWTLIVGLIVSLYRNDRHLEYVFNRPVTNKDYPRFTFLHQMLRPDDVVLSDPGSNWLIPVFNGKVIASVHPLYWAKDEMERSRAVERFFLKEEKDSARQTILNTFKPDYILIDQKKNLLLPSTVSWLRQKAETIFRSDSIELIKLRRPQESL